MTSTPTGLQPYALGRMHPYTPQVCPGEHP